MKTLQLLLLEDEDEEAKEISEFLGDHNFEVTRAITIQDAERKIQDLFFDIIILDIMIDGKPDGIVLAQQINEQQLNIPFLFLTSTQSKHFFDLAKLTQPATYLLKPYNTLELLFSIELAIEKCYKQSNTLSFNSENAVLSPTYIFVKKNKSVMKIAIEHINYVEVKEKYCNLISEEGNFLIKLSLIKVKELLSNPNFTQVHRNFLVNIKKIKEIYFEDNLIILMSTAQIPFSERYKALFIKDNDILN